MCWDISLFTDLEIVKKDFTEIKDLRSQLEFNMSHFENVQAITFPNYPIIYNDTQSSMLVMKEMEWGVLPVYLKDQKEQEDRRRNMINVRSERILEDKKSYWYRLRSQRCLIPVNGTYEHRKINGWKKKVPYFIAENDRDIFYIPALYQWHENPKGEKIGSFGMLTRSANSIMANIHNDGPNKHRMPLYLPKDLESAWISDINEKEMAEIINFKMPPEKLKYFPVYTLRGYPDRPDGKHRYDPYTWDGLPPLGKDTPEENLLF